MSIIEVKEGSVDIKQRELSEVFTLSVDRFVLGITV